MKVIKAGHFVTTVRLWNEGLIDSKTNDEMILDVSVWDKWTLLEGISLMLSAYINVCFEMCSLMIVIEVNTNLILLTMTCSI